MIRFAAQLLILAWPLIGGLRIEEAGAGPNRQTAGPPASPRATRAQGLREYVALPHVGYAHTGQPSSCFDDRLADLDRRAAEFTSIRADFRQTRHTALLKKPMVSSGRVAQKGGRARWDTLEPHPSTMTIGDGEMRIYYPEHRLVEIYPLAGALREIAVSPMPRLEHVRDRFEVIALDPAAMGADANEGSPLAIELRPTHADLSEHISTIRILFDTDRAIIHRIEITDADAERTEIEFTNVELNPSIDETSVTLQLPKGTLVSRPAGDGAPPANGPAEPNR